MKSFRTTSKWTRRLATIATIASTTPLCVGFVTTTTTAVTNALPRSSSLYSSNSDDDFTELAASRFPTSAEDQVRQASIALRRAAADGERRHVLRLLLPLIGATELDDWPGGARQQIEAAAPLVRDVLAAGLYGDDAAPPTVREAVLDEADGVRVAFAASSESASKDSCAVLLPTAETVSKIRETLDAEQVGPNRNLILVNPQWRRRSDFPRPLSFGGLFGGGGGGNDDADYVESVYRPTFSCTSLMVEGDQVRVLRSYPGPWRVYLMTVDNEKENDNVIDWRLIGTKDLVEKDPRTNNKDKDDALFDHGKPSYQEIADMITSQDGYVPRSMTERAAAAFTFIKDTL